MGTTDGREEDGDGEEFRSDVCPSLVCVPCARQQTSVSGPHYHSMALWQFQVDGQFAVHFGG
jgi:hypothetical protein